MWRWCGCLVIVLGACGDDDSNSRVNVDSAADSDSGVLFPTDITATETRETVGRTDTPVTEITVATETVDTETTVAPDTVETTAPDTTITEPETVVEPDTVVVTEIEEPETVIEDTVVEDTFVEPDTTAEDTAPEIAEEVVEPDNNVPGVLIYQKVPNIIAVDDLTRIAWHPSGDYALLLGRKNEIFRYDATSRTIASAGKIGGTTTTFSDIEPIREGGFLLIGVESSQSKLWKLSVGDTETLTNQVIVDATTNVPTGTAVAITYEPLSSPSRFAIIAGSGSMYISYFYLYTDAGGLGPPKGFNTSAGPFDVMWGDPSLTAGTPALVTSEGLNGGGSHTYILAPAPNDLVVANGWLGSFGNGGRAGWRPWSSKTGGGYGVVCGWSSNKLYVYDGAWVMGELPVPTGAAPQAIAWRDHKRALVVGRVIGINPYATVIEIRAGETTAWESATLVDQSIQNFDDPPWFGQTSSMHLLDVAWRPGVACDEGLVVGSDNGQSFSPTLGTIARFYDSSDAACDP